MVCYFFLFFIFLITGFQHLHSNKSQSMPCDLLMVLCDSILQNAPIDIVKAVYDACFYSVIRIILQSDDHSEMQVVIIS